MATVARSKKKRKAPKAKAPKSVKTLKYRECLKSIRKRAGVSAEQCAAALGFKWGTGYSRYENSKAFDSTPIPAKIIEGLVPLLEGKGYPAVTASELWDISDLPASRRDSARSKPQVTDEVGQLIALYPNLAPGTLVEAIAPSGEIVKASVYRFNGNQYELTMKEGSGLFVGQIVSVPTLRGHP